MESLPCSLPSARTGWATPRRLAASSAVDCSRYFIPPASRHGGKPSSSQSSWGRNHAGRMVHLKASNSGCSTTAATTTTVCQEEAEKKISALVGEIKEILGSLEDGNLSPSAYDTAWVARIPSATDPNKPHFPMTLDWLLMNQMGDGSWGESTRFLLFDRLLCTLSSVLALHNWEVGEDRVNRGLNFLRSHVVDLENESESDIPCGFELAFPAMWNEAKNLGIDLPYDLPSLKNIIKFREKKMSRIPMEVMHLMHTSLLYTLEAFQEVVQWEKILFLQSEDGSFLTSPAATAVAYMRTGDKKCLDFLNTVVTRFKGSAPSVYPVDLFERMWIIDTIERLGIGHHFTKEINDLLDYIYRNMGMQGISWGSGSPVPDLDNTCMGLRIMRLHNYPISSDMLELFRDSDGNFEFITGQTHQALSGMFNLYRFVQISFPGEKVLKEAKSFAEEFLKDCVEKNELKDKWSMKKALDKEVVHALKHPWRRSFQRLEAREYLDHYGVDDVWLSKIIYWMYYINNPKYLKLAKLDYNQLQTMYKREMNYIQEWWNDYGYDDPFLSLASPTETHFSIAATLYEPQFSASRIAYTKSNCIENVLKDLFDKHEPIDDLRLLCEAVEQCNSSLLPSLPIQMKSTFGIVIDTLDELVGQASKAQGKDMLPYFSDLRKKQMKAYMKQREIKEGTAVVPFKDLNSYLGPQHSTRCSQSLGFVEHIDSLLIYIHM